MSTQIASSQKLMECLIKLEGEGRADAKMELMLISSELMPQGVPNFLSVVRYPKISELVAIHGRKKMLAILVLMVKDFCGSFNVVRNMNEDQMIETALMLLEECGNFRLEDYMMMFGMAKKRQFEPQVRIMDRIDIQIITSILDTYWEKRHNAGVQQYQLEENAGVDPESRIMRQNMQWDNKKGYVPAKTESDSLVSIGTAIGMLADTIKEKASTAINEDTAKSKITVNPNYNNPYKPD